jgi:hypothetical protein
MLAVKCNTFGGNLRDLSLRMLRPLGGSVGVNYCCRDALGSGIREVQAVFVSCPLRTWVAVFGKPRRVRPHFDRTGAKRACSWEQDSSEGPVRCLGYIFERFPGIHWIIVKQLSICGVP